MKKFLRQSGICVTILALFVLAVLAQQQVGLLGPETTGVALVTAAVLPPAPDAGTQIGPIRPPPPIDRPGGTTAQR